MVANKRYKIRLKKGDFVVVRSGKYKGQSGKVISTHPLLNAVTVEGLNIVKKHVKPDKVHPQGGIIEITKPIAVGKVGIMDPVTKGPTRITHKIIDGTKKRFYKSNGKEIQ
jgi:large subunit ribosomal protein L24